MEPLGIRSEINRILRKESNINIIPKSAFLRYCWSRAPFIVCQSVFPSTAGSANERTFWPKRPAPLVFRCYAYYPLLRQVRSDLSTYHLNKIYMKKLHRFTARTATYQFFLSFFFFARVVQVENVLVLEQPKRSFKEVVDQSIPNFLKILSNTPRKKGVVG